MRGRIENALLLIFAVFLMMMFAGCGKTNNESDSNSGKTIVLGAITDFKNGLGREGQSMVFDTLTSLNRQMEVLPNIIESWETNSNCSVYTLKVKNGVEFSDGTPLTADIVKYSMEAWAPYRDGSFIHYMNSIDIVDDHTLTINFSKGYGNLLIEMSGIYVSLPGSLDDQGNVTNWTGTGPFVLTDYKVDQSALLRTNRDYWNKERMPAIDEVKWIVIPDENARVMALQSGLVDALGVSEHYCKLPFASIVEIMDRDELAVDVEQDLGLVTAYVYNYKRGPMTDIHLRRAVTLAIDRETISRSILYGIGKASGDFLSRVVNYSPSKENAYTYDAEAAKSALNDGGYFDTDGDGIVEQNGQPLMLKLLAGSDETSRAVAVFVGDCLRKVGIDTEVEVLENAAFGDQASKGNFDICQTHPWVTTPQTYMSWRGATSDYDDFGIGFGVTPDFEAYLESILTSTDKESLQKLFDEIWQELYAFCPGTGLYVQPRVFVHKKNVSGFIFNPDTEVIDLSGVTIQ